ncbi:MULTISPECIES: hypothetical protein [unclassified Streptomyces]|uniref:hypothetical protein n=1 Tax=unclassified Streptomyces TaxID=2593676 RepID=UPI002E3610D7|nr:hypothetical protein [Streptomyces sp. NBC_00696]
MGAADACDPGDRLAAGRGDGVEAADQGGVEHLPGRAAGHAEGVRLTVLGEADTFRSV